MINAYLNDTITISQVTYDQWNKVTKVDTNVKGRIEFRTKLVRNIQGEQVVSSAKVLLPLIDGLGNEDRITYEGKEYRILNVSQVKDFSKKLLKVDLA
jgi:hypothetical protein